VQRIVELGGRICLARRSKDLTQEELAHQLGVSMMTVSRWERGQVVPPVQRLYEIADALGIQVAALLEDEKAAV